MKRYFSPNPARVEHAGYQKLIEAGIATADLVAWGSDGAKSFTIFRDLAGYTPGDKLLGFGSPFEPVLISTADLAAQLHCANLHHRDLYLCHFMIRIEPLDVKLIDVARVKHLPRLFRRRWIVKDLAQFWYSTTKHPITDEQRGRWLARYCAQTGEKMNRLQSLIERKVRWIARHDAKLNRKQPTRNVSLNEG